MAEKLVPARYLRRLIEARNRHLTADPQPRQGMDFADPVTHSSPVVNGGHEQMARPCNTGRMPAFSIFTSNEFSDAEVLSLYESVGWAAYTRDPELLTRAIRSSSFVVAARNANGELVGLARVVSDDATICYLQDILVRPPFQGAGVGRALVEQVTARYAHVRQTVLITDNEPGQRAFYEAMGFMEGSNFAPEPVRVFALFR